MLSLLNSITFCVVGASLLQITQNKKFRFKTLGVYIKQGGKVINF